jgi:sialic acid synthase SpsE
LAEIDEAVRTLRQAGADQIALLKCTSAYPAPPEEANLHTVPHMAETFEVPVGLSDHTLGIAIPVAAVALGACIIEKHLTLSRSIPGPDSVFSVEPSEFQAMVQAARQVEKSLGKISYEITNAQKNSLPFRRSLFVVKDIKAGEKFSEENVRSIRPGFGLHPRYLQEIIGRSANKDIQRGTPMTWSLVTSG